MKHIRLARAVENDELDDDELDDDEHFHYDEEYDPFTDEVVVRGIDRMMLVDRTTGKEVWRGPQEDK